MSMANTNALKARIASRSKGGHGISSNRKVKTATELEEEAARIKAIEDELEEMARKDREKWKRIKRFFTLPNPVAIAKRYLRDKLKIALKKLDDKNDGSLEEILSELQITSKKEKWMWVKFWGDIDSHKHNKVRYDRFCTYFKLVQDTWTQRIFDLANLSKTGALTFIDWLTFCRDYLFVDRRKTEEFSFRVISRRGGAFRPTVSVIDLEDMRLFLKFRFKLKLDDKKLYRTALEVFDYVDSDGDGGLYIDEFAEFTAKNPVFVRFSHCYQNHFRKVCMNIKYWVEKSRQIKKARATGLSRLTSQGKINVEDEKFTLLDLRDPVVDERGKPVITSAWVQPKVNTDNDDMSSHARNEHLLMAAEIFAAEENDGDDAILNNLGIDSPQKSRKEKRNEKVARGLANGKLQPLKEKKYTLDQHGHMVEVDDDGKIIRQEEKAELRKFASWFGPFMRSAAANKKFEEDFAEVYAEKLKRKFLRGSAKKEANDASKYLSGRTYKRVVKVCEDLIYSRKWLRLAFGQWMAATGMEHRLHILTAAERAEAARLVGRRQLGRVLGAKAAEFRVAHHDAHSNKNHSPEMIAEMERVERLQLQMRQKTMTAEEKAEEAERHRLKKEEDEHYSLHDTIVANCRKEDDHEDDPDHQQTMWYFDYLVKNAEPISSGRFYRGEDLTVKRDRLLKGDPCVFSVDSRAVSRPQSNIHHRPRTGEYLADLPQPGRRSAHSANRPGSSTCGNGGGRNGGREGSPNARRAATPGTAKSGGRPGTGGGRPGTGSPGSRPGTSGGGWSKMFGSDGSDVYDYAYEEDGVPCDEDKVDPYERDKFFTNEIGETFLFPTLNPVDNHTNMRKSLPGKHYVFQQDVDGERPGTAPGYNSDSSCDL